MSFVLLILLIGGLLSSLSGGTVGRVEPVAPKAVLHLLLEGEVVDRGPSLDWIFEDSEHRAVLHRTLAALRQVAKEEKYLGVVVDYRAVSMGWATANAIRRELEGVKRAGKFIYAYADRWDEMGVFISTPADKIFVQPFGDFEINGLAADVPFFKNLLKKLDVEPQIFRVGKFKSAVEPFTLDQMSVENREQTRELLTDLWTSIRDELVRAKNLEARKLDEAISSLGLSSVEAGKRVEILADGMFSDEFDRFMREQAKWNSDDEINYVSVDRCLLDSRKMKTTPSQRIAVVTLEGEIVKGESQRGSVGDDTILETVRGLREDEDVKAIVVRINSPGGDALASDIIYRELAVADEEKPVIASLGDIAASGGYYAAAGARLIFAEPTTITGSIGVFGLLFNAQSLLENRLGIRFDRVATHPSARYGSPIRPLTEIEARTIQSSVERTYARFLSVVQKSRKFSSLEGVARVAEGRVWSGSRAKEINLVDEMGGLDAAIRKAAELAKLDDKYKVEYHPQPTDRFSRFLMSIMGDDSDSRWMPISISILQGMGYRLLSSLSFLSDQDMLGMGALLGQPVAGLGGELKKNGSLLQRARVGDHGFSILAIEPISPRSVR